MLHEVSFASFNGRDQVQGWIYVPACKPKGIVQVIHGFGEHSRRYLHMISAFLDAGYIVAADDHVGHGKTAMVNEVWGDWGDKGPHTMMEDEHTLKGIVCEKYPDLPYFLFGHSMGSFITRIAVSRYSDLADKYICCGTAGKNHAAAAGLALCDIIKALRGERAVSPFLENIVFGSYNKRFDGDSKYEWLTKDREIIEKYAGDRFCTFHFTVSAMHDLIKLMQQCNSKNCFKETRNDLPILIIAGDSDPVGNYGKGVKWVYNTLKAFGKTDVTMFLYKDCRHEIHNDSCRDKMTEDILKFIAK